MPAGHKEMPILESIQKTAGKRQIQVIAVNTELLDTYRRLARKLADFELTVTHDAGNRTAKAYDVNGIPHRIIIDRTGHIVRIHRGYREDALDEIVADINQALRARNTPPDAVKDAVPR